MLLCGGLFFLQQGHCFLCEWLCAGNTLHAVDQDITCFHDMRRVPNIAQIYTCTPIHQAHETSSLACASTHAITAAATPESKPSCRQNTPTDNILLFSTEALALMAVVPTAAASNSHSHAKDLESSTKPSLKTADALSLQQLPDNENYSSVVCAFRIRLSNREP